MKKFNDYIKEYFTGVTFQDKKGNDMSEKIFDKQVIKQIKNNMKKAMNGKNIKIYQTETIDAETTGTFKNCEVWFEENGLWCYIELKETSVDGIALLGEDTIEIID